MLLIVFPTIALCNGSDPFEPLVAPVEDSVDQTGVIAEIIIEIIMGGSILAGIYMMNKGNVMGAFATTLSTIAIGSVLLAII